MAIELGHAYVTVIPEMRGAHAKIAAELGDESLGREIGGRIGRGITLGVTSSAGTLPSAFSGIASKSAATFQRAFSRVASGAGRAFEPLVSESRRVSDSVALNVWQGMDGAARSMVGAFKEVGQSIRANFSTSLAANAFRPLAASAKSAASSVKDAFSQAASKAGSAFSRVTGTVSGVVRGIGLAVSSALPKPFKEAASKLPEALKGAGGKVGSVVQGIGSKIKSILSRSGSEGGQAAGSAIAQGISAKAVAIGNILSGIATKAFSALGSTISNGISRSDTLNSFKRSMETMGETGVDTAVEKIRGSLDGLPTSTAELAAFVGQIKATGQGLEQSTDIGIAFNNAMLAGGMGAESVANAMEGYRSILASGKVDQEQWLRMVDAAPNSMRQLAESMLGAGKTQNDLRKALNDGTVTLDDFNQALVSLNGEEGMGGFADQAKAATGGIQTSIDLIQSRLGQQWYKIIDAIGGQNIAGAIDSVTSKFNFFGDVAVEAINGIMEKFDLSALAEGFSWLPKTKDDWVAALAPAREMAGLLGQNFGQAASQALASLGDYLGRLGAVISDVSGKLSGPLGGAMAMLAEGASSIASTVGGLLLQAIQGVGDWLAANAPMLGDIGSKIGEIAGKIGGFLVGAIQTVAPIIGNIASALLPVLSAALDAVSGAVDFLVGLWDLLVAALSPVIEALTPVGQSLLDIAEGALKTLGDALSSAGEWFTGFKDTGTEAIQALLDFVQPAIDLLNDVLGGIGEFVKDPVGTIQRGAESIGKAFQGAASGVDKSSQRMGSAAATRSQAMQRSVTQSAQQASTGAQRSWSQMAGVAESKFESMRSTVSSKAQSAASSVQASANRAVSSWSRSASMTLKADTSAANNAMQNFKNYWANQSVTIKARVSADLSSTAHTRSGTMASGGVIRHADGFIANRRGPGVPLPQHIVGEAGAEAVIPLTNRRYVAPFAQTVADFVEPGGATVNQTNNYNIYERDDAYATAAIYGRRSARAAMGAIR